jgi:hypothetical protein
MRISVSEQVLRDAISTIEDLRKELADVRGGKAPLTDAIQKSVEHVAQGDTGRNKTVTAIVRPAVFAKRDVAKARKSAADRKQTAWHELAKARGLGKTTPEESFAKSRGARVRKEN